MAKEEWGIKRTCQGCAAHFYDMRKNPPTCPACGTVFDVAVFLRVKRRATSVVKDFDPVVLAPVVATEIMSSEEEGDEGDLEEGHVKDFLDEERDVV